MLVKICQHSNSCVPPNVELRYTDYRGKKTLHSIWPNEDGAGQLFVADHNVDTPSCYYCSPRCSASQYSVRRQIYYALQWSTNRDDVGALKECHKLLVEIEQHISNDNPLFSITVLDDGQPVVAASDTRSSFLQWV